MEVESGGVIHKKIQVLLQARLDLDSTSSFTGFDLLLLDSTSLFYWIQPPFTRFDLLLLDSTFPLLLDSTSSHWIWPPPLLDSTFSYWIWPPPFNGFDLLLLDSTSFYWIYFYTQLFWHLKCQLFASVITNLGFYNAKFVFKSRN